MRSVYTLLVLLLCCNSYSWAQDVVQLRNGKNVVGTIVIDDQKSSEGFWLKSLETGGTFFIKWSQVPSREKNRILDKPTSSNAQVMDGVRIVTSSSRLVLGDSTGALIDPVPESVSELNDTFQVKTRSSSRPVLVPRSAVESYERLRIRESDAFSKEEMVTRREANLDPNDADATYSLGEYALLLELYPKAKSLWQSALQLDPSRKGEIESRIAKVDNLILESEAKLALETLLKLAQKGKFDEAISAADLFRENYADTDVGLANPNLAELIEKEKASYEKNRSAYLAQKIPDAWRSLRKSLLAEYAKKKYRCAEARNKVSTLDQEIQDKLSEQFNCSPEDLLVAWESRGEKKQKVSMSDASWLYQPGGNGGEIDYQGGGRSEVGDDDPVEDFARKFGGKQRGKGQTQKKEDPPETLKTSDEWWASASTTKRKNFLTAEYALNSGNVKVIKKDEKKCSRCRGEGTRKDKRNGEYVQVLCDRCHGGAIDFTVTFD